MSHPEWDLKYMHVKFLTICYRFMYNTTTQLSRIQYTLMRSGLFFVKKLITLWLAQSSMAWATFLSVLLATSMRLPARTSPPSPSPACCTSRWITSSVKLIISSVVSYLHVVLYIQQSTTYISQLQHICTIKVCCAHKTSSL